MVSIHLFHRIRKLRDEGHKTSAIARELGVDRKTVRKYLHSNSPPEYKPRASTTRKDPTQSFAVLIEGLIESNESLTAREIFEHILPLGYSGSERSVDRRVGKIKAKKPKERFFEQEYTPGEQAQFDFKERVEFPFADGVRIAYLHFGSLPYSDICWVHAYPFKNYECFIDGQQSFF